MTTSRTEGFIADPETVLNGLQENFRTGADSGARISKIAFDAASETTRIAEDWLQRSTERAAADAERPDMAGNATALRDAANQHIAIGSEALSRYAKTAREAQAAMLGEIDAALRAAMTGIPAAPRRD